MKNVSISTWNLARATEGAALHEVSEGTRGKLEKLFARLSGKVVVSPSQNRFEVLVVCQVDDESAVTAMMVGAGFASTGTNAIVDRRALTEVMGAIAVDFKEADEEA